MPERVTLARHAHGPDQAAWLAQFGNARVRDIYAIQVAELAEVRLPGGSCQAREAFIDAPMFVKAFFSSFWKWARSWFC